MTAHPHIKGALLIDGGHLHKALETAGLQKDNRHLGSLVRSLQRAYGVESFVRREWHQGTESGEPNETHQQLAKGPPGFRLCIRGMKYQRGMFQEQSNDGRWRRCSRQTLRMRVEKGVDVALALSIAIAPDPAAYDVVVVVTGDSDLQAAFEQARSSGKRVYVCSARNALAEDLRGFLHVEGFNRFVFLDDVILMAVGRPPKCNWGHACPEDQQRDARHLRSFTHPCPDGVDCPIALQCASSPDPEHREHLLAFLHACPLQQCVEDDPLHRVLYDHPETEQQRPLCESGGDCPLLHQDPSHARAFRHVCPLGSRCKDFLASQTRAHRRKRSSAGMPPGADDDDETDPVRRHLRDFVHPCRWGASCRSCQDPLWNWEHVLEQLHSEPPTATAQQGGGKTRRRRSGNNKKSKNNSGQEGGYGVVTQVSAAAGEDDEDDEEDGTSGLVRLMQTSSEATTTTAQPEPQETDVGGPKEGPNAKAEQQPFPTAAGDGKVPDAVVDDRQRRRSKNGSSGPSFLQGLFGTARRIAPEPPVDSSE